MPDHGAARILLAGIALSLVVARWLACSSPPPDLTESRAGNEAPPSVLVSMGAIETSNLDFRTDRRDTWTQLVFTHAMPGASVFVNLAGDNITAERVIETQLPELASLHPDVVTIWVEAADVRLATPPATYQRELTELIAGARQAGASKVLLLTPPASEANLSGGYAASVAEVASKTGATLVPLDDTSDRYSDDGQRHIADAVIAALR